MTTDLEQVTEERREYTEMLAEEGKKRKEYQESLEKDKLVNPQFFILLILFT